ncbi:membrane-associated tyrosine- and threonine-specific cdc2-inhibitory kinase-like [Liolophura sinensis]|uniref:membrane-associated tyrosine- and threonine-specific cdc2-inhibitory kinase-like n=1 Tax=Liolophura sinensis TaxID=3198878 RepID=UPI003159424C
MPRATMRTMSKSGFSSPRPQPQFFPVLQTFSTKKDRGTPVHAPPPRPPVKSCPPISRIFPHTIVNRAQVVSFREHLDSSCLSTHYDENSKDLYFHQCFEIVSKIGAGSFGDAYKVRSREDGKYYAVKRSRERFRGESDRKRKLEEVAKHETLPPHPNCVRFFKAWEERQHLYIQTELCLTSLNTFAENQHDITEIVLWNYLVDLLMALKHLHDHNLIHMDIKPENIFISKEGICKLGDFGLVIDLSKVSDLSEAQEGDPKYLAPELMEGQFSKPADIFSLGMTILELASDLDLPRGGEGWHQLRKGRIPEEFLHARSFDLKYVIKQMLDADPRTRPTVDQLLAFPCIRKVMKRRQREYMFKSAISTVSLLLGRILQFLLMLLMAVLYPIRRFKPHTSSLSSLGSLGSRSSIRSISSSQPFDSSISDDDCFEADVSVTNNSLGAPLDSSSSDTDLYHMGGETAILAKVPLRNAFTSPLTRTRSARVPSPMSSSPVVPSRMKSFTPLRLSPNSSLTSSPELERPVTPTYNMMGGGEMDELIKPTIEPKNLLEMFEAASDED